MSQYFYAQYKQQSQEVPGARYGYPGDFGTSGHHHARCRPPAMVTLGHSHALTQAYATLYLQPGAPEPVVKAAYRALAARYHPDAGGDPQQMTRLNQAYRLIQQHAHQ